MRIEKVKPGIDSHIHFWLQAIVEAAKERPREFAWRVEGRNRHFRDPEGYCPITALCDHMAQQEGKRCRFKGAYTLAVREHFGPFGSIESDALWHLQQWSDTRTHPGAVCLENAVRGVFTPILAILIDINTPLRR